MSDLVAIQVAGENPSTKTLGHVFKAGVKITHFKLTRQKMRAWGGQCLNTGARILVNRLLDRVLEKLK